MAYFHQTKGGTMPLPDFLNPKPLPDTKGHCCSTCERGNCCSLCPLRAP